MGNRRHGMVVRKLAKDGFDVVGADISPRLLETVPGLEISQRLGITYVEADATASGLLGEEVADAAGAPVYLVVKALRPPGPSV